MPLRRSESSFQSKNTSEGSRLQKLVKSECNIRLMNDLNRESNVILKDLSSLEEKLGITDRLTYNY